MYTSTKRARRGRCVHMPMIGICIHLPRPTCKSVCFPDPRRTQTDTIWAQRSLTAKWSVSSNQIRR